MIRTLAPKYYSPPNPLTDVYFFRGIKYDFMSLSLDSRPHEYAFTCYYQVSGITVKTIEFTLDYTADNFDEVEVKQIFTVTPIVVSSTGEKKSDYAASQRIECEVPIGSNRIALPLAFRGLHTFDDEYLGILVQIEKDSTLESSTGRAHSAYFDKLPELTVDGTENGYLSENVYYTSEMASEIQRMRRIINDKANRSERSPSGVVFYDYTGETLYSYTARDFLRLNELPANPMHSGLLSKGWNWSLARAKQYVQNYGNLDIGQMYETDDGTTRLYLFLTDELLDYAFNFLLNGSVSIDWGDGSSKGEYSSSDEQYAWIYASHSYKESGYYTVSLTVTTGSLRFENETGAAPPSHSYWGGQSSHQRYALQKVELGKNVELGPYAFIFCPKLLTVLLPYDLMQIGDGSFEYCESLYGLVLPSTLMSISESSFSGCSSLQFVSFSEALVSIGGTSFSDCSNLLHLTIPDSVSEIQSDAFLNCGHLSYIIIPNSLTQLAHGVFGGCYALSTMTLPSSLLSIGQAAFADMASLQFLVVPDSITAVSNKLFRGCAALRSVIFLGSVTSIGDLAFSNCSNLRAYALPETTVTLGERVFEGCDNLRSVMIPETVEQIGKLVFFNCPKIRKLFFTGSIPPTAVSQTFAELPRNCVIYVPRGSLLAYTTAENYPHYPTYQYVEYDYEAALNDDEVSAYVENDVLYIDGPGADIVHDQLFLETTDAFVGVRNDLVAMRFRNILYFV